jgi:aspartyl protease family protein
MSQRGGGKSWGALFLAALIVLGVALLLFQLTGTGLPAGEEPRFFMLAAFLALCLSSLIGRFAMAPRSTLRWVLGHLAIWLALGMMLVGSYAYRGELDRVAGRIMGELMPSRGQPIIIASAQPAPGASAGADTTNLSYGRSMRFNMANDGQFHVDAVVGATPVRFILDTGASDVMLSPDDARRLGYDPATLTYDQLYRTASGTVRGARITLPAIDIGPIRIIDVQASVLEGGGETSLLGMTFLGRLSSFQVDGPTLTLIQ